MEDNKENRKERISKMRAMIDLLEMLDGLGEAMNGDNPGFGGLMDKHRSTSTKSIGDTVKLVHQGEINYLHDIETKAQMTSGYDITGMEDNMDLFDKTAIVAEIEQNYEYNCGHCEHMHHHDLVIYYPHNKKKYYTSTSACEIVKDQV